MHVCETINGPAHTSKVWAILRSLDGQRKTNNGTTRVTHRKGVGVQEIAEEAAKTFFLQMSQPHASTYDRDDTSANVGAYNVPFTMTELNHALQ